MAEPDLGSLACVFQMLYIYLYKTRKEVALVAAGVGRPVFYPIDLSLIRLELLKKL